ncbi:MAG: efflux RND transporter permease subunit, partial [Cyanobacteria bacterium P01_A01_bin.80]
SVQVRTSVIFSTVIIAVVFAPIFTLTGVEGRIFAPMGWAYLVSILSSTLVAMTLSPALCAILLTKKRLRDDETWVTRWSQKLYRPLLNFSIKRSSIVLLTAVAAFVASMLIFTTLGRVFLPEFQERTLVNSMLLYPGTSLEVTNQAGNAIEQALKDDPRIASVQMRSGRAPGDADAAPVNLSHLDIEISDVGMKDREATVEKVREEFAKIPGSVGVIGGFISHRMDEILSGVRSAIAVKIFGPELEELRALGKEVEAVMSDIPGLVDLQLEPQVPIKQVQIEFDRDAAARYGISVGDLSEITETALNGRVVSQVLEKQQLFDLLVWLKPEARNNLDTIRNLLVDTPNGQKIPLAAVAKIDYGTGPNTINRENVSRLIVVSTNVSGRDLGSAVDEIRAKVKEQVQVPSGYFIQYGGQFESEQRASQNFLIFGGLSMIVIAVLMYFAVKSIPATLMIMSNLPLALAGGVFSVALGGGIISVASMVGFITLFGVATRNGLLLVENYNSKFAMGMPLREVISQGSMERLVAILMTALTSALGMVPLVIGTGAGKEILQPLAIVVLGGLFTSTALTLLVLPALYSKFGKYLIPKQKSSAIQMEIASEINNNKDLSILNNSKRREV